jgi:hypothetical protein
MQLLAWAEALSMVDWLCALALVVPIIINAHAINVVLIGIEGVWFAGIGDQ